MRNRSSSEPLSCSRRNAISLAFVAGVALFFVGFFGANGHASASAMSWSSRPNESRSTTGRNELGATDATETSKPLYHVYLPTVWLDPAAAPHPNVSPSATPPPQTKQGPSTPSSKGITPGTAILAATFNSIGVELAFTGDDNANAAVAVQFKKATDTTWRDGLPLWEVATPTDGGPRAFYGSVVQLDPGTNYVVRIQVTDPDGVGGADTITRTIATRSDNLAPAASLAPGYYVTTNGSDTNSGTNPGSSWATLSKAFAAAPAGAVVQVGPGFFKRPAATRLTPITVVAQYPAVDDARNVINVGQHTIVDSGTYTSPSGSGDANAGVWQQVAFTGPGFAGAPKDATYTVWKWTSTGVFAPHYGPTTLGYAGSRDAIPGRLARWDLKGPDLKTTAGWVEKLYTNQTYNYGWYAQNSPYGSKTWNVYLRMPKDLSPNDYYLIAGNVHRSSTDRGSTFVVGGPNVRLSGLEIHAGGIEFTNRASFGVVDHDLIGMAGIGFIGYKPSSYGSDDVVENNRIVDTDLWSDDPANQPAIPWDFIKGAIKNADGTTYPYGRLGQGNETGGVGGSGGARRLVIRDNTIDGPFNGITFYNVGFDRYATQDLDIEGNLIMHTSDDAIEPENQGINIRIWNNQIQNTLTALSTGPLAYGPVYFFRNQVWRTGGTGVGRDDDGTTSAGPVGFKYSGSSVPTARIYVINNTFWTDAPGVSGGDQYAGGGPNSEWFYLRNNIFAMTKYAFSAPTNTNLDSRWDEDYDYFYTSDPTRGMNYGSTNQATVTQYRSSSGQGSDTNRMDTSGRFHTSPALTNPATGDLTLADGSPQIDAGTIVPNIADQSGVNFLGPAPDRGAIEAK